MQCLCKKSRYCNVYVKSSGKRGSPANEILEKESFGSNCQKSYTICIALVMHALIIFGRQPDRSGFEVLNAKKILDGFSILLRAFICSKAF